MHESETDRKEHLKLRANIYTYIYLHADGGACYNEPRHQRGQGFMHCVCRPRRIDRGPYTE